MPEPDEHAEVEAEIAALMRTGFGFEPHRLDPPPIEPTLTFDDPRTPATPGPRRFTTWVAAAVAVAIISVGAYLVWPSDDPTRDEPRAGQQVRPLDVRPGTRGTDAELAALVRRAAQVPGGGTEGKSTERVRIRTISWSSASGAGLVLDGAGVVTSVEADPHGPGSPASLPRTPDALVAALAAGVADCQEGAAFCAALGLSDLAGRYVLPPRFTERVLRGLGSLEGLAYVGDSEDRLGRMAAVLSASGQVSDQRVLLLLAPRTGQLLGVETVSGPAVVALHYVVGAEVHEK